jgi:glutamyl-Q tRNA(Asp) synthetase
LYVGRFAPSPTGPLHFGSLTTALASYLDARANGGRWLVRIEDLDSPREQPGAAADILRTLDAMGLHWDGEVVYQSRRKAAYEAALRQLGDTAYRCTCSRREIQAEFSRLGLEGPPRYPGTCRRHSPPAQSPAALRLKVDRHPQPQLQFIDALQGEHVCSPVTAFGDFVLRRRDGLFAYQLAVVLDDQAQGVNHVVRGIDLLQDTAKQMVLQALLSYEHPSYMHVPIATHGSGQKMSKQSRAPAVDANAATDMLLKALQFLRQPLPQHSAQANRREVLEWAVQHWTPEPLRGVTSIAID